MFTPLEGSDLNSSAFSLQATTTGQARLLQTRRGRIDSVFIEKPGNKLFAGSQEQYANLTRRTRLLCPATTSSLVTLADAMFGVTLINEATILLSGP
jgi:hypothetical protein